MRSKPDKHFPRQVQHLHFIFQFTSDIRHATWCENPVEDALAQMEANAITQDSLTTVDFQALDKAQPYLATLQTMQKSDNTFKLY